MTEIPFDLPNACQPEANLLTGGQPSRACLKAASTAGYHTVVNLCPPGEFAGFDEAEAVRALGMNYVCIPVASPHDLDAGAVQALDEALAQAGDQPVLVHCASGNRVGALLALHG
ncbi:MAG: sulfur transferase domain-containing protein, partial [Gammaproteobacteria bacterium]